MGSPRRALPAPAVAVVVSDIHGIRVNRRAFDCALDAISKIRPDAIWDLGDHQDGACFNAHPPAPGDRKITVRQEGENSRALYRDLRDAGGRTVKQLLALEGNHDYRYLRWLETECPAKMRDSFPETVDGFVGASKEGFTWVDRNRQWPFFVGDLGLFHGQWYNKHHAAKHADELGVNCIYGHTHRPQQFTRRSAGGVITATGVPCLRQLEREWEHMNQKASTGWANGFAVVCFEGTRVSSVSNVIIENGRAAWGGMSFRG